MRCSRRVGPWWAVLALVLWACPRSPSAGGTGGEKAELHFEPKKDSSANDALEQAIRTSESAPRPQAIEAFLSVRKAYPDSTAGEEALYRAGILYFESGDFGNARKRFNELLFENPLFDKGQDAKLKLGISALNVGAYRDAYQTLSSLADKLSGEEKTRALEQASRAAEGAGLYGESLRIAVKLVETAKSPEDQKARVDRVTELVEGRVGFLDVAKAVEETQQSSPAWPILEFKLARIYYHLRDFPRLTESLQLFLREAPNSPYAPQAKDLLARANRGTQVKPKTVGIVLPMTGKFKPLGEAVMRGVGLALQGSDVELIVKDTQGDPTSSGKAVEDLAFDEGAIAILGPLLGEDSRRAALVAEELQVPILTFTRTEDITDIGPHVFRNMLTNTAQARALAEYGTQVLGYKNFALLYPNIPYGVELSNDFWDEVTKAGGTVRGAERYDCDQTTFTSEAKKLVGRYYLEDRADYLEKMRELKGESLDPFRARKAREKAISQLEPVVDFDALFIPDDWTRVGLVAPALAVEDIITNACDPRDVERIRKTTGKKNIKTVTLFGGNQWSSPKGRSGLPLLLERGQKFVLCSIYVDGFFADSKRRATQKFVAAYRDSYKDTPNHDPGLLEAIGYDSAQMVKHVIDKVRPNTREQFRDALANVKGYEGATGTTSFDAQRDAQKPLFFLTIEQNGVKELETEEKEKPRHRVGG